MILLLKENPLDSIKWSRIITTCSRLGLEAWCAAEIIQLMLKTSGKIPIVLEVQLVQLQNWSIGYFENSLQIRSCSFLQYPWHLPRNMSSWSVYISEEDVKAGSVNVVEVVKKISKKERDAMRKLAHHRRNRPGATVCGARCRCVAVQGRFRCHHWKSSVPNHALAWPWANCTKLKP